MKNFGKMTSALETIILKGPQIGINEDGSPVFAPDQQYNVLFFRNGDGVDIVDLAKAFPHPFYIAVDASGAIISMTDDIEQSQIAGVDIIGIDNDFGFTYGPGGNVYGKIWDGTAIVEPTPAPVVTVLPSVTLWERLTEGEAEQVNAAMATQPFRTRQIFLTANTFRSDHELWPLLEQVATELFGAHRASELLAVDL